MFFQKAFRKFKLISLAIVASCLPISVTAQVTPDGTTSTEVTTQGNNTTIDRGDRIGDNLFHSFDEFSVPTGSSAGFNNAGDIANIFSRVTGSNVSSIDGLLSANGTANLFLINPNGIIFGENASLDLGGSFFASTASGLLFEGDTEFSASDPQAAPLLEVNIPIGLSFRDNAGDININGSLLEVPNGENLSLIGGNVDVKGLANGSIFAIGGRVELAGLTGAGEIEIVSNDGRLSDSFLVFPEAVSRGDVTLSNFAFVSVAGNDGGDIAINARNITLEGGDFGASQLLAGIVEPGVDRAQSGDITLDATGNINILDESSIFNQLIGGTSGNSGNIDIETATLNLDDSFIIANLSGTGDTGKIIINADRVSLNNRSQLNSEIASTGIGNTGGIKINSNSLEVGGVSFIGARNDGRGNSGEIAIETGSFVLSNRSAISSQVSEFAIGNSSNIAIDADNVTIVEQTEINSSTAGQGDGGNIKIDASEFVLLESGGNIISETLPTAIGNGGNITINSPNLDLGTGNAILTSTSGVGDAGSININSSRISLTANASIISNSEVGSQGQAGSINIDTATLRLERDGNGTENSSTGITSSVLGNGDANDINIRALESIYLSGQSTIQSIVARQNFVDVVDGVGVLRTEIGNGDGGNIKIDTKNLILANGAQILSTTEGFGNAGNIAIDASQSVSLTGIGRGIEDNIFVSTIASDVDSFAVGEAGTIEIDTSVLNASDGAEISAITRGDGNASDITINASQSISLSDRSFVASVADFSSMGDGGNVSISTQELDINSEAQINTSNFGRGNGGDLFVLANSIDLNNGTISAANIPIEVAGETPITGGEIDLQAADIITLDNNSIISAEAGSNANGGNVNIDTDIIVAFPGNNDILANAEVGRGGNIQLDTKALFGIAERPLNPFTNDINASSEFGLQGNIAINTPEVDPTSGLVELPQAVGNSSEQISQNPCQQGIGSKFIITGKGGLPPNPTETLNGSDVQVGLVEPLSRQKDRETRKLAEAVAKNIPAMGWVFDDSGKVTLTAHSNANIGIGRSVLKDKAMSLSSCEFAFDK